MRHGISTELARIVLAVTMVIGAACAEPLAAQSMGATEAARDEVKAAAPLAVKSAEANKPMVAKPAKPILQVGKPVKAKPPATWPATWMEWASAQVFGPPDPVAPVRAAKTPPLAKFDTAKINIAVRRNVLPQAPVMDAPVPATQSVLATATLETGAINPQRGQPPSDGKDVGLGVRLSARVFAVLSMLNEGPGVAKPVYRAVDQRSATRDIVALELANRAYDETQTPGRSAFTAAKDWRVLEHAVGAMDPALRHRAVESGFDATAYINSAERRIIVAIAGSCSRMWLGSRQAALKSQLECRKDWIDNDINAALIRKQTPAQFLVARDYIASVIARHGADDAGPAFAVACSGHSLGGGACAFAASALSIPATTLNPISAGVLRIDRPDQIVNYVVQGDLARVVYGLRGLAPTGTVYVVDDGRDHLKPVLRAMQYGALRGTAYFVSRHVVEAFMDHTLGNALDRLVAQAGIKRVH